MKLSERCAHRSAYWDRFLDGNMEGAGRSRIGIEGVNELHGAEHEVIPDRIEAGTFLIAGAIAGREVTVNRVRSDHLAAVTDALLACGFHVGGANGSLTIHANGSLRPLDLKTQPYPGFPTDMPAQIVPLLSTASGESSVTERIFPQRFMHASELKRMGAAIELADASAKIRG